MKKLLFIVALLVCLTGCNKNDGPEYTTAAEFGKVIFKPDLVTAQNDVHVTVPITSIYGLRQVQIVYALGEEATEATHSTQPIPYLKTTTAITFASTIPRHAAGTKVTFRVVATTFYGLPSWSEVCQYEVAADEAVEQ